MIRKGSISLMLILFIHGGSTMERINDVCETNFNSAFTYERNGNISKAVSGYFSCREACQGNLLLAEKSRVRNLIINRKRVEDPNMNACRRYKHAQGTITMYMEYIRWYDELSKEDEDVLYEAGQFNIHSVVRSLGNVIVARGLLPNNCDISTGPGYEEIFERYKSIENKYLSRKSIDLWYSGLRRYPKWETRQKVVDLQKMVCNNEVDQAHMDALRDFNDKLGSWINTKLLWKEENREINERYELTDDEIDDYQTIKSRMEFILGPC